MFTKTDLKNGDVIVRRNGDVEIAIVALGVFVCQYNGWNDFDYIREDLTACDGYQFDIMKVIRPTKKCHCRFTGTVGNMGKLVYDRERDTVRELTIDEIEREFGIKVKFEKV